MTTPRKRRDNSTMRLSMCQCGCHGRLIPRATLEIPSAQFLGQDRLRAADHHPVPGAESLGDEPAVVGRPVPGDFPARETVVAALHVNPGPALMAQDGLARNVQA